MSIFLDRHSYGCFIIFVVGDYIRWLRIAEFLVCNDLTNGRTGNKTQQGASNSHKSRENCSIYMKIFI